MYLVFKKSPQVTDKISIKGKWQGKSDTTLQQNDVFITISSVKQRMMCKM